MIELGLVVGLSIAGALMARSLKRARQDALEEGDGKNDEGGDAKKDAKDARKDERDKRREEAKKARDDKREAAKQKRLDKRGAKPKRTGPRGLLIGDVLLYADTELWLAGMIELDEEGFVARLFPTPGSSRGTWVVQLDDSADEVMVGDLTDRVPDGRVPDELPMGGMRVSLRKRGHATVSADGDHVPHVTEFAGYVVLGGPGGRTLVVIDFQGGDRLAIYGELLSKSEYDLLPGGD